MDWSGDGPDFLDRAIAAWETTRKTGHLEGKGASRDDITATQLDSESICP